MCRDSGFVAGAGATEIELSRLIQDFGATQTGLDQYAVKAFGEALEVVPRTLAATSGNLID
jgi:T-complex protein 1 subunit theta